MKAIVIRQPWAWLIVNGFKDIENRTWGTRYRGPLLIQASARRPSRQEMHEFRAFALKRGVELPEEFELGGIVGTARLENVVTEANGSKAQLDGCSQNQEKCRSSPRKASSDSSIHPEGYSRGSPYRGDLPGWNSASPIHLRAA